MEGETLSAGGGDGLSPLIRLKNDIVVALNSYVTEKQHETDRVTLLIIHVLLHKTIPQDEHSSGWGYTPSLVAIVSAAEADIDQALDQRLNVRFDLVERQVRHLERYQPV